MQERLRHIGNDAARHGGVSVGRGGFHKDYYEWCAPNAGGFVLDAKDWASKRVLYLVKTVQYTKEAQA